MSVEAIADAFRRSVGAQVELHAEGHHRYQVLTPFRYNDGDHLGVVLKQVAGRWQLTDEGSTLMRLSYDLDLADLQKGTRAVIIDGALDEYGLTAEDGVLSTTVEGDDFGNALYSFIQGLQRISAVKLLSRERVASTFGDDFRAALADWFDPSQWEERWHDPERDADGRYAVDYRLLVGSRPVFLFTLGNDTQARDATIALHQFERWHLGVPSVVVFADQATIARPVLARLSDVCDKQFSSLGGNEDRIPEYLRRLAA
ncbi:MAG TPA: hypothetical protein DCZ72_12600 [Armatimonadetes bacterium]|nr:hypothetical protein [Armatimonadota bacterium]